jgi:hypothetical protein
MKAYLLCPPVVRGPGVCVVWGPGVCVGWGPGICVGWGPGVTASKKYIFIELLVWWHPSCWQHRTLIFHQSHYTQYCLLVRALCTYRRSSAALCSANVSFVPSWTVTSVSSAPSIPSTSRVLLKNSKLTEYAEYRRWIRNKEWLGRHHNVALYTPIPCGYFAQ